MFPFLGYLHMVKINKEKEVLSGSFIKNFF